jgi:hypothetical protein
MRAIVRPFSHGGEMANRKHVLEVRVAPSDRWFKLYVDFVKSGDLARSSEATLKVYIVLSMHADFDTGECYPGIETISRWSGLGKAAVYNGLKQLQEMHRIAKTRRGYGETSTAYVILPPRKVREDGKSPRAKSARMENPAGRLSMLADEKPAKSPRRQNPIRKNTSRSEPEEHTSVGSRGAANTSEALIDLLDDDELSVIAREAIQAQVPAPLRRIYQGLDPRAPKLRKWIALHLEKRS